MPKRKTIFLLSILLFSCPLICSMQEAFTSEELFEETEIHLNNATISFDPQKLKEAALYTLNYYFNSKKVDEKEKTEGLLLNEIISPEEAKKTLEFIVETINNDEASITDPAFLKENLTFIKWNSDEKGAQESNTLVKDSEIRLTHYVVFSCDGAKEQSDEFPHALYSIIDNQFNPKAYTKQEVLDGALENALRQGQVESLVWVNREGLEDGLLQGSVVVFLPNYRPILFTVDKNNGIDYNRKLKDNRLQERYWYFREVGFTQASRNTDRKNMKHLKLVNLNGVAFAGDLKNFGIGKIVAFRYINQITNEEEFRLGVIADTGGAFKENQFQLDLFEGIYVTKKKFWEYIKLYPDTVEAYFIKRK